MSTVFVSLTDQGYLQRAIRTLTDLRTKGNWCGDVVLLCVDFDPPDDQMKQLNVIVHKVEHINHFPIWKAWLTNPIPKMDDNRHYMKVTQWDKLYVFSDYFKSWDRVVFLDAGIRVLDDVCHLLALPWERKFLAPDDSDPYDNGRRFNIQVHLEANQKAKEDFIAEFGTEFLDKRYFLNCIFLFDTYLLHTGQAFGAMKELMYKYPIMRCNEMGIMNLYFRDSWVPFPQKVANESKYLFGWSEQNYRERPNWQKFCFLKYPVTI